MTQLLLNSAISFDSIWYCLATVTPGWGLLDRFSQIAPSVFCISAQNFAVKDKRELYKKCLRFNFQSLDWLNTENYPSNTTNEFTFGPWIQHCNSILTCLCISSTCLWGMLFKIVYISGNFSSGMTTDALQVHAHKWHCIPCAWFSCDQVNITVYENT